jgi:hypothetical protein
MEWCMQTTRVGQYILCRSHSLFRAKYCSAHMCVKGWGRSNKPDGHHTLSSALKCIWICVVRCPCQTEWTVTGSYLSHSKYDSAGQMYGLYVMFCGGLSTLSLTLFCKLHEPLLTADRKCMYLESIKSQCCGS